MDSLQLREIIVRGKSLYTEFRQYVVRNPRVYARLADGGRVTRAGTGVRRMVRLITEATGHDIGISISETEVVFTLPRQRRDR